MGGGRATSAGHVPARKKRGMAFAIYGHWRLVAGAGEFGPALGGLQPITPAWQAGSS